MNLYINKFESYLLTERCASSNTISAYIADIKQFVRYLKKIDVSCVEQVREDDVRSFIRDLHRHALKSRTIARKISSIKSFFEYISRDNRLSNVAQYIELPKKELLLPKFLSEEEVEVLLSVANKDKSLIGKRNCVMLYLLYASGMRISELVTMHLENVFFDSGHISLVGKGGKERLVPLPHSIMQLLSKYIQTTLRVFMEKNHNFYSASTQKYLFPVCYAKKIKPISRQSFWMVLKRYCYSAGICREISPHQFRHSLATHLLKNGADLRSIQLLLGHEHLSTVQIYTHVETSYLREIYDKNHPRSGD